MKNSQLPQNKCKRQGSTIKRIQCWEWGEPSITVTVTHLNWLKPKGTGTGMQPAPETNEEKVQSYQRLGECSLFQLLPRSVLYALHLQTTFLCPQTQQQNVTALKSQVFTLWLWACEAPTPLSWTQFQISRKGTLTGLAWGQVPKPGSILFVSYGEEEVGSKWMCGLKDSSRICVGSDTSNIPIT